MTWGLQGFRDDVMAGCDIQKGDRLYRQVLVVRGPGLTQDQIDLKKANELLGRIVESLDVMPGFSTDEKCVFMLELSPEDVDELATFGADQEDADPLDNGEQEHDGREPRQHEEPFT